MPTIADARDLVILADSHDPAYLTLVAVEHALGLLRDAQKLAAPGSRAENSLSRAVQGVQQVSQLARVSHLSHQLQGPALKGRPGGPGAS